MTSTEVAKLGADMALLLGLVIATMLAHRIVRRVAPPEAFEAGSRQVPRILLIASIVVAPYLMFIWALTGSRWLLWPTMFAFGGVLRAAAFIWRADAAA